MTTYNRLPIAFERGEGVWLWDDEGKRYLDAVSGIAVCALGHAHPAVTRALCQQAGKLLHTSNLYRIKQQEALGERLTRLAAMDKVFFCNSGAEANETALKIARLHGHYKDIAVPTVIVAENSFHGRTLATLTATGNRRVQAGFEPLVQGFIRVPYNDLQALRTVAANNTQVVAVLLEPIQGEGGVRIPSDDYLAEVRGVCDEMGWLLMLDEVQTGMGRTGHWFAYQHGSALPDVVTLAKALGNGVPIGACMARGEAAGAFKAGQHASTFGGNPLACSAALSVIETLEANGLLQQAAETGVYLVDGLRRSLEGTPSVVQVRGKGMIIGIELSKPCGELVSRAADEGLLINVTAERVIRLLPPLILTRREADQIIEILARIIAAFDPPLSQA